MKILLYSFSFWPQTGGIESVSHTLASGWSRAGHEVTVVTYVPSTQKRDCNYQIVRRPTWIQLVRLAKAADVVHINGFSFRCCLASWIARKPVSWKHSAYQLLCLDACGWINGAPAPLNPVDSFWHHWRLFGPLKALYGITELTMRRIFANLVNANISITHYQAKLQPAPRQLVIYNPIENHAFAVSDADTALKNLEQSDSSFTYLGRLITDKGVDDLLWAFAELCQKQRLQTGDSNLSLKIIGTGPEEQSLRQLARQLQIDKQVSFLGSKGGCELTQEIARAGICVIPSAWQEPMGIVCLELMEAGKPLIVSQHGGLAECAGEACITFENRNRQALAQAMQDLLENPKKQKELSRKALLRSKEFDSQKSIQAYLDLFSRLISSH